MDQTKPRTERKGLLEALLRTCDDQLDLLTVTVEVFLNDLKKKICGAAVLHKWCEGG